MIKEENEYKLTLNFSGTLQLSAKIQRYFSPKTFTKLYNALPLEGPFINNKGIVQIFVNFSAGFDKLVQFAKEGSFLYDPRNNSFFLFLESRNCHPIVQLGTVVEEDLQLLKRIPSSGFVKIQK
ncbi:MAG: hypothetical protein JTT16_04440 [Candidatus Brockarchaeota archaeon]|nr:hypothetical protein [Candidatus Brockarchaeota archaeon]MBO3802157.1 hypothetical protein [Candidatus Brockarchaeota archaeon]